MSYTYKSLAFFWAIASALVAVSVSGMARGWWFVLLIAIAITFPALVIRRSVAAASGSLLVSDQRERSPADLSGIDLLAWENEGGART